MKIALLLRRFITTGGAERYAVEIVRRLAAVHEVHIFAQEWDQEPAGVIFHRVSRPFKKPSFLNQWWFSWRTAKMARGFDVVYTHERVTHFDVMHIHCGTFIGGFLDPARSTRKKSALKTWLKVLTTPGIWAYGLLEKIHFRFQPFRHWIAVSEMTRAEVQRYYELPDASFTIAHSGVDQPPANMAEKRSTLRREFGFKEDEIVLLFVGSEFRRKGLDALIAALPMLKNKGVKLVVAGGGDPAPFQKQAVESGVDGQIVWAGLVKNTAEYYAAADIFVLPTLYDAGPMAPLEAMAHGCAAIFSCAAYAGMAEMIADGEAVLLGNPKDPAEIAAAVERLMNPAARAEFARKGRALAARLTWDRTAGIVRQALEKSAAERGRLK
jgi:UDP-glucose:(heptosyl)LPS alpha-1,3-glucosyltransferase